MTRSWVLYQLARSHRALLRLALLAAGLLALGAGVAAPECLPPEVGC